MRGLFAKVKRQTTQHDKNTERTILQNTTETIKKHKTTRMLQKRQNIPLLSFISLFI